MSYFKTTSKALGGEPDVLRCGNPASAWDRFKDKTTQYNGVMIPHEQAPIWQLFTSMNKLSPPQKTAIEDKAEEMFYRYIAAEAADATDCKDKAHAHLLFKRNGSVRMFPFPFIIVLSVAFVSKVVLT